MKEIISVNTSVYGSQIKKGEIQVTDNTSIFRAISESMGTGPPKQILMPTDHAIPTLHSFVCDAMGINYEPTPASKSQLAKYSLKTYTAESQFKNPKDIDVGLHYTVEPIERNFKERSTFNTLDNCNKNIGLHKAIKKKSKKSQNVEHLLPSVIRNHYQNKELVASPLVASL